MALTKMEGGRWLVEMIDPLTRDNGKSNYTAQLVVTVSNIGIHIQPWRLVRGKGKSLEMAPLACTPEVQAFYQPLVLIELFQRAVLPWTPYIGGASNEERLAPEVVDQIKSLLERVK